MISASIVNSPPLNDSQWYNAAYVQDDWKVTPRLTFNLGIRYENNAPAYDSKDVISRYQPSTGLIQLGNGVAFPTDPALTPTTIPRSTPPASPAPMLNTPSSSGAQEERTRALERRVRRADSRSRSAAELTEEGRGDMGGCRWEGL